MRRWIAILLAACAALSAACATVPAPRVSGAAEASAAVESTARPRLLFVSLDAVPYGVVDRVMEGEGDDAAFVGFDGPVPLISTFPSTTSLALGGILEPFGLDRSAGYEHRFFDRAENRKRGGGPISYRRLRFPWRRFFDWQLEGFAAKGIKIFHLQKSGRKAVDRSLEAFAASDAPVFHLYHDLTDLIGHVQGPDALEPLLRHLDAGLEQLRNRHGTAPFHTVIYSDHGLAGDGEPLDNVRRDLKKALRRAGFRVTGRIRGPRDVVFVPYGLVSSFAAFTAPGSEVGVAEVLAAAGGVDLCAAVDGDGWRVVSARGDARLERRDGAHGEEYAYRPLSGDPLGYAPEGGPEAGSNGDPDPWRPDSAWLEATRAARYPDALYRIVQGFELVENPASILCSVAEGHMYGSALTVFGSLVSTGRLRWTHGALEREASLGFVISDAPGWRPPEAARFDRALVFWAAEQP